MYVKPQTNKQKQFHSLSILCYNIPYKGNGVPIIKLKTKLISKLRIFKITFL